ncbi:MAG: YerC/YecD family TrpR-related protein [Eubacteriales bacterium]|nr:YerC/YecD family TrpR-related protein [Eubacteriales bacterium]
MDQIRHPGEDVFYEAVLSLRTAEECRAFFEDISTIKELQAMAQRFRVACLLDEGRNYIEVSDATGASSATISRVNRCLHYGSGYRTALNYLKKAGKISNDGCDMEE